MYTDDEQKGGFDREWTDIGDDAELFAMSDDDKDRLFGGRDESIEDEDCVAADAEDANVPGGGKSSNMQKHDAKYHPDGYDATKDKCVYREKLASGDNVDSLNPENVKGEVVSKGKKSKSSFLNFKYPGGLLGHIKPVHPDGKSMKMVVDLYGKWDHPRMAAASMGLDRNQTDILRDLWDYVSLRCKELGQMEKEDRHEAIRNPPKGEIPVTKDAYRKWKSLHGGGGQTSKGGTLVQPSFMLGPGAGGLTYSGGSGGGWVNQSNNSKYGQYFHSQGQKKFTNEIHKETGLYKTQRPGGKALAREEDVPGMSAFNSKRPSFQETAQVPSSLTKEQLSHFRYTANGSTYPMVGNVNGSNYIVKRGFEKARKNKDLTDHIMKEVAADRFIRAAGLNAPVCATFELPSDRYSALKVDDGKVTALFDLEKAAQKAKEEEDAIWSDDNATIGSYKNATRATDDARRAVDDFRSGLGKDAKNYDKALKMRTKDGKLVSAKDADKELFKIAEYVKGGVSLVRSWKEGSKAERAKIKQQVIDSYPIISFLENVDAFKNDNVLCDKDSNLWFIDNGACFDYRAQGGKKLLSDDGKGNVDRMAKNGKPWFYERDNPLDYNTGFFGLLYAPDQKLLQEILEDVDDIELVKAARKYDFPKLVETLPDDIRKPSVIAYAKKLQDAIENPPPGWPIPAE